MEVHKTSARRAQAHARYRTRDGVIVPGVTTVLGVLNKPALVPWANKLGLQGISVDKYVDSLADIGSIAHYRILCHFKGEEPDLKDYAPSLVEASEPCIAKFHQWLKEHKVKPLWTEREVVSESERFGGCLDLLAMVDGLTTVVDFKTGKAIYDEYFYQTAAYTALVEENSVFKVEQATILQIGRNESEGFSTKTRTDLGNEWQIFKHCLAIYNLKKRK